MTHVIGLQQRTLAEQTSTTPSFRAHLAPHLPIASQNCPGFARRASEILFAAVALTLGLGVAGCATGKQRTQVPQTPLPRATVAASAVPPFPNDAAPVALPYQAPEGSPIAIYSNTMQVEALTVQGDRLWVATRGGLEEYQREPVKRLRVYTTLDGLPSLFVTGVGVTEAGTVQISTPEHDCKKPATSTRFSCTLRREGAPLEDVKMHPMPLVHERVEGSPVTARFTEADGTEWLGTAGLGTFKRTREQLQSLTPGNQISSNHVVAIAEWKQANYFATFDQGLSRFRTGQFQAVALGPRMLNDLTVTSRALYVATSEGLYVSYDGERFERDARVTERAISDLAFDPQKRVLYAVATNSLWELPEKRPNMAPRVTYQPGGSQALQAVDVSPDGTVFLASEDRGVMRRESGKLFTHFDRVAGYPTSWAIDVIAIDHNSALVGSLRHGVFSLTNDAPIPGTLNPWVLFLGRDSQKLETIFVGTQGGALELGDAGPRSFVGLPNPCVHTMARLKSGLWIGTEGGLALYE